MWLIAAWKCWQPNRSLCLLTSQTFRCNKPDLRRNWRSKRNESTFSKKRRRYSTWNHFKEKKKLQLKTLWSWWRDSRTTWWTNVWVIVIFQRSMTISIHLKQGLMRMPIRLRSTLKSEKASWNSQISQRSLMKWRSTWLDWKITRQTYSVNSIKMSSGLIKLRLQCNVLKISRMKWCLSRR